MLRMRDVRKVYRTEHIETYALSDLALVVEEGEFVAVMGPSGSGKTTFLNIAGLLDSFDGGSYELDGEDVSRLSDTRMSQIRNRKIGFIFQSFNLIPDLKVFDNVDVPLRYRGLNGPARRKAVEQALATVGLSARLRHLPAQVSGGQQQRVAIARALVGQPRLKLADEPTVADQRKSPAPPGSPGRLGPARRRAALPWPTRRGRSPNARAAIRSPRCAACVTATAAGARRDPGARRFRAGHVVRGRAGAGRGPGDPGTSGRATP